MKDGLGAALQVAVERAGGVRGKTTLSKGRCNRFDIWIKMVSKLVSVIPSMWKKPQKPLEELMFFACV